MTKTHDQQATVTQTEHHPELNAQPTLNGAVKTTPKKPQFKAIARIHAALGPAGDSVQLMAWCKNGRFQVTLA